MASHSRPNPGFRFAFNGIKINAPPDSLPPGKYPIASNIRGVEDNSIITRPGVSLLYGTNGTEQTDIGAYVSLNTDDQPRFLSRGADDKIWADNGSQVGSLAAASPPSPGATLIPFRPAESPDPWLYVANGSDYQKFSSPSTGQQQAKVGIAEPQVPPQAGISSDIKTLAGQPIGGTYTLGGTATGYSEGNRVKDTVQGIFPDPAGTGLTTLHVSGGGQMTPGIYLAGSVNIYLWPRLASEEGAFLRTYPLDPGTAAASAIGNSLNWNPPQYDGTTDPNVQPMQWAQIDALGNITGYVAVPTAGGTVGSTDYDMVVLCQLYIPVAGEYHLNIDHDDGMFFAIQGAQLVSGPQNDPYGTGGYTHTQTAVQGYKFASAPNPAFLLGADNASGHDQPSGTNTWVINFPTAGTYSMEIDYSQWQANQCLNVYNNLAIIYEATGISSFQRGMVIDVGGNYFRVLDVFQPLPSGITVAAIQYYSGTSGLCVVVPQYLAPGPGTDESLYTQQITASLRRGALVNIGVETCYVLDVTTGPTGSVCFETTTVNTHGAGEGIVGVPAIQISGGTHLGTLEITSNTAQFSVAVGVGTATTPVATGFFESNLGAYGDEDYLHFSVNVDNLANLNELKLLFDVGDGSFTQNFYFYSVRPSDIALGVDNTLTQLGVAQLVSQRATIDEEQAAAANNQYLTDSGAQTSPGSSQWSELTLSISELTRVGNDQTKSLANVNAMQLLVNANASVNIQWNSVVAYGTYEPDVGQDGAPYLYRYRPRSLSTGVKGNPSPAIRYGVNPRRQQVTVILPPTAYDPQFNVWDIYRYGGSVTSWRFIGYAPVGQDFLDNYGDDSALAGDELEFDNFEPWPTVDFPAKGTATVNGTLATVSLTSAYVPRYLPGNRVQIGGNNVYTLWTRPILISGTTYLLQFQENAGYGTGLTLNINEPVVARQTLPYVWGPDANGTFFGAGDPLRPGTLYFSKPYAPDSAPDTYNIEIVPPSEPILGGEVKDGIPYCATPERWFRLYPQLDNPLQRYNPVQQEIPRGLAAPFGHTTDGQAIYFWAKDGIWSDQGGSLTDEDLYSLFPHEGVLGQSVSYGGVNISAPDYSRAGTFRLAKVNQYLHCIYQGIFGEYHTLVCDLRRKAWSVDDYTPAVCTAYHPPQQEGTVLSSTARYPTLLLGNISGQVGIEQASAGDFGSPISGAIATTEWDGGDLRADKQWGDIYLDNLPAGTGGLVVQPMTFGAASAAPTTIASNTNRIQSVVSVGGALLEDFLGILLTWTDASGPNSTQLFIWQPSFLAKPETIEDRFTDWYAPAQGAAAFIQGFILHADTYNDVKGLAVRDADTLTTHAFTPAVQLNGEQTRPYSFNTPFIAHMLRIEPTDEVPWRFFDVVWIFEATPEQAETWTSQGTSFGLKGYVHVKQLSIAYSATAPVNLIITAYDGTSPSPITLPATSGYQKTVFIPTFNKGQLYFFSATSTAPFQLYLDDCEALVGQWGRSSAYVNLARLGGPRGDMAKV